MPQVFKCFRPRTAWSTVIHHSQSTVHRKYMHDVSNGGFSESFSLCFHDSDLFCKHTVKPLILVFPAASVFSCSEHEDLCIHQALIGQVVCGTTVGVPRRNHHNIQKDSHSPKGIGMIFAHHDVSADQLGEGKRWRNEVPRGQRASQCQARVGLFHCLHYSRATGHVSETGAEWTVKTTAADDHRFHRTI